jgi:hypothetical protein
MSKKMTISLLYYNDQDHIGRHLEAWKQYDDLVKFQVIDDGSKIPAKSFLKDTVFPDLDSSLYRIQDDIPWNIPGARNLSATVCDTEYILICDMDQVFDREAVLKMQSLIAVEGKKWYFSFKRFSKDDTLKRKCKRKTCGTMLLSIKSWWAASGYDEDMAWSYGHNDPLFRKQLTKIGMKEVTPEIYCEEFSADCKLNRKSDNRTKYHQKIKNLPRADWNCLRFNWKHEKF